ncbi:orotidine 5'-phosphate decarboxylase [Gordonia hirsuta DSM 44140 = NBRC 16056]|uniref:Orotidine-5'-phosphate decarboxylase n=1 Tax=Gordonia hirsuta DSM 44140 = NBRC 16056 TaxID=1121927 RepID=L7LBA8_9ACTN|nr:orotidine-5'-phosphate decarboxylase [Gordonia hirsuta]GAC57328.1 orotidine 5'-phosphate decarboxylase [Gordonia hirsuta DSM 44140 = NBRC 16056]
MTGAGSGTAAGGGFAARYRAVVGERGRLCAGIDPHAALLEQWGLPVTVDGLREFAQACVTGLGPTAAVIKPQVAFFEVFGSAGLAVLEETIAGCREAGALVLADAKRGDIGSTMAAYTTAWLDDVSPLCSDAVTASPYLGFGALDPALAQARATDRAVFVLARTSNPDGARLQTARTDQGRSVAQSIVDAAAAANADGSATAGVVVGATREHGLDLSELSGPILSPGLGAQGATAQDLAVIFADTADLRWLLPAASRSILAAGPVPAALAAAVEATRDEIETALIGPNRS